MADVAQLAGVSHQTVSRVIHGSPQVRPQTRSRVVAAMEQLDYRPNPVARALVTGRSMTLGVVTFDTTLYGPASTLLGVERAAHDAGYFVSIVSVRSLDRASVRSAVERLRAQAVDAIVLIAPQSSAAPAFEELPAGLPVVAAEAGAGDAAPVVRVDQVAGAAEATRHLLDLGHLTVWHIAGPQDWPEAEQRVAGWRSALEAAGADVPPPLTGDWSPASGYELGRRLARREAVTAVFAANDQMALGLLRALHESGRPVPEAVSVVGFDDIPEAPYLLPPLTTVHQDFDAVGRRSVELLLAQIATGERPPSATVDSRLVVRSSTSAAA
ncbi:MAG TPA: LacI family DNA-binding transcriptional regulator [Solirubrobacteraceae bacterium]|nr:LacI family DNA-binding transcriptional regulator [Solirubrobacteraceae bacterium]